MTKVRVALVTNMMAPYRIPLFNRLARRFDLSVHVAELRSRHRQWLVPLHEIGFRYDVLKDGGWGSGHINVCRCLWREHPDVVIIGGWGFPEAWSAMSVARLMRVPVVVWAGLAHGSSRATSAPSRTARRVFLRNAKSFVTYSRTSAELLSDLGASPGAIAIGRNVGDVDYYGRPELHGLAPGGAVRFLFVGELLERKGVRQLLEAFGRRPDGNWTLTIAGKGPLESEVHAAAGRDSRIRFVGFQTRDAVRRLMQHGDVFVLPSLREVGAIVTSEALASGLFVIASAHDGVAPDLVNPTNGLLVDPTRASDLDGALLAAAERVSSPEWSRDAIAAAFLATNPLDVYAEAFQRAVGMALGSPKAMAVA